MNRRSWFPRLQFDASSEENLSKSGINSLFVKVSQGVAAFILNVLIGRLGGPSLLGSVQTIISTSSLAALFYANPASAALTRNIAIFTSHENLNVAIVLAKYVLQRILISCLIATSLFVLISNLYFKEPPIVQLVTLLMIFSVALRSYTEALHYGLTQTRRMSKYSFWIALTSSSVAALLLLIGVKSVLILLPVVASNILFAVTSRPPKVKGTIDKPLRKEIATFVSLELMGTMGSSGFQQLSVLVSTVSCGVLFTGNLSVAFTLTSPLLLISGALSSVLFPALSVSHKQGKISLLSLRVNQATRIISLLVVFISIFLITLSPFLIKLFWGHDFESAIWLTQIMTVISCIYAVAVPSVAYVTSKSNTGMKISAFASLTGALAGIISWIFLLADYPEIAIISGLFISGVVTALWLYAIAWKQLKLRWAAQTVSIAMVLIFSFALSACARYFSLNLAQTLGISIFLGIFWLIARMKDLKVMKQRFKRAGANKPNNQLEKHE